VTYTALAIASVITTLVIELVFLRTGLFRMPRFYLSYLIVIGFQLLTNGYLTGTGIVGYSPEAILGFRIANAPVEDLLFGFSLVVLTMAVWTKLSSLEFQNSPATTKGK
jgi:lycopene cyclase domain-containing protein